MCGLHVEGRLRIRVEEGKTIYSFKNILRGKEIRKKEKKGGKIGMGFLR